MKRTLRPTSLGAKAILFYGVLTGAFFAAPYANLIFLLIAFLTVLGLVNVVWTWRNLSGATAEVPRLEPLPAGIPGRWSARVLAGRRTRFGLRVRIDLDDRTQIEATCGLVRGTTEIAGLVPPLSRGVYPVRRASLCSSFPLGLLSARAMVNTPEWLVVYPAPSDLPDLRGGKGGLSEALGGGFGEDGFLQPSELREFVPGDDPRRIHHKASARRGVFVVKEWEGGAGAGIEVVLDRRTSGEELELALSLLSAVTLAARDQKEVVCLKTQGLSETYGPGHRTWTELLTVLASAEVLPGDGPSPPPASPSVPRLPARGATGGRR